MNEIIKKITGLKNDLEAIGLGAEDAELILSPRFFDIALAKIKGEIDFGAYSETINSIEDIAWVKFMGFKINRRKPAGGIEITMPLRKFTSLKTVVPAVLKDNDGTDKFDVSIDAKTKMEEWQDKKVEEIAMESCSCEVPGLLVKWSNPPRCSVCGGIRSK